VWLLCIVTIDKDIYGKKSQDREAKDESAEYCGGGERSEEWIQTARRLARLIRDKTYL
jgi:hypothetical protein